MRRKKEYRLRFTQLQNHYMWCNARDLKLTWWTERFQRGGFFEQTVNLRTLTGDQLRELRQILEQAGKPRFLGRKDRTRKALRRKLRTLDEFDGLSAIDRLGELQRR